MTEVDEHWERVWSEDDGSGRSWFSAADRSLAWVRQVAPHGSVIDVGGGSSPLVDRLLAVGHDDVAVVDVAASALEHSRRRLGDRAEQVSWIVADVRDLELGRTFDVWHDRAVLHFLVKDADRQRYVEAVRRHVPVGGHVVVATFAPDGPTSCSGLPVRRQSADDLAELFGASFALERSEAHDHVTPWEATQSFTWVRLVRVAA